jgi:hypothetical protein
MKVLNWLFGAIAGLSLLVAGIMATGADLISDEERSRGSAGITLNGIDAAPQEEPPAVAGIVATVADLMPPDDDGTADYGIILNGLD